MNGRQGKTQVPQLFDDLWATDRAKQNVAYRAVLDATNEPVSWADSVWDDVVEHLRDDDNHNRSIAAQVLANLSISTPRRVLDDFPALAAVARDERFVTARHALQALWKIGTIGPQHRELLKTFVCSRFEDCHDEKNATLIRADLIEVLARAHACRPHPSLEAAAQQLVASETDDKYRKKYATVWRRTTDRPVD